MKEMEKRDGEKRREEEKMKSKWTSWRWEHSKAVKVSITVSNTVQSMMIMTES